MKLAGKYALVAGGATGIGRATAELYASEGAAVAIMDYNEEEGRQAVSTIEAAGGTAVFYRADVRNEGEVATALTSVDSEFGCLDAAVCAAGVLRGASRKIAELSLEEWEATIGTNLTGTFLTVKHATPLLEKAGTSVLMVISSGAGVHGGSSSFAYAASKGGLYGMRFNLEGELGPKGVRVHTILPGSVSTPLKVKNMVENAERRGGDPREALEEAKRLPDPIGVARILLTLASKEGEYMRGTVTTL